ncbi:MAG: HlyD family efflux transporter periplasmic adaptor subunit, partial [Deltaproteobacteria bacterium]
RQATAAEAQAEAARKAVAAGEAALERARVAVSECRLTAPRDGVVQLLPFEVGELVPPGATLATIVDLAHARATFYIPNADLAAAVAGAPAEIEADAWPGEVFTGTVATVATEPEFTPRNIQTRSDRDRLVYKVEVEVDNADGRLRPGMPIVVRLPGTER